MIPASFNPAAKTGSALTSKPVTTPSPRFQAMYVLTTQDGDMQKAAKLANTHSSTFYSRMTQALKEQEGQGKEMVLSASFLADIPPKGFSTASKKTTKTKKTEPAQPPTEERAVVIATEEQAKQWFVKLFDALLMKPQIRSNEQAEAALMEARRKFYVLFLDETPPGEPDATLETPLYGYRDRQKNNAALVIHDLSPFIDANQDTVIAVGKELLQENGYQSVHQLPKLRLKA